MAELRDLFQALVVAGARRHPIPDLVEVTLHIHYRHFVKTTSRSAPVPRVGTQVLVGPPLERLPSHRGDRFPGYAYEPETDSRHLYAGRRSGSRRISPELIPDIRSDECCEDCFGMRHRVKLKAQISR